MDRTATELLGWSISLTVLSTRSRREHLVSNHTLLRFAIKTNAVSSAF